MSACHNVKRKTMYKKFKSSDRLHAQLHGLFQIHC